MKDLIFIDPEDEVPIRNFVQIFGRGVHVVWPDDRLGDVLTELKKGRTHMALVRDVSNTGDDLDPFYELKGIITLEGAYLTKGCDSFICTAHDERLTFSLIVSFLLSRYHRKDHW